MLASCTAEDEKKVDDTFKTETETITRIGDSARNKFERLGDSARRKIDVLSDSAERRIQNYKDSMQKKLNEKVDKMRDDAIDSAAARLKRRTTDLFKKKP